MSKVVKVSDGAYQLIADVASRHQIYLIDALDNILFNEDLLMAEEEDDGGAVQAASNPADVDEYSVDRQREAQTRPPEAESDPCPKCGVDVGWSTLPSRRSLFAFMLTEKYYRICPECHKETPVSI